jgi:hypothetical protein
MSPLSIVRVWFVGLLGLAILGTGPYLAWDWYRYDRDDAQLYWAIGLAAFSLLGRFISVPLMGFGGGPPPITPVAKKRITRPDGTQIHVNILQRGRGPTIVLTHGWSLNSRVWGYAQRELPNDCKVVAWDLRGLGQSSKSPTNDYSLDTMAGDLLQVIRETAEGPAIVVGHSIGGMICQTFCRLFPTELGTSVTGIALSHESSELSQWQYPTDDSVYQLLGKADLGASRLCISSFILCVARRCSTWDAGHAAV